MGFFDFLKSKKKKQEGADSVVQLDDSELAGIEPPETRFTEEYREFLETQEAAGAATERAAEAAADAADAVTDVADTAAVVADTAADIAAQAVASEARDTEGDTV